MAEPAGATLPGQGWKLHLSGTSGSVLRLLAAALPVLLPERCAFTVAAGLDDIRWLTWHGQVGSGSPCRVRGAGGGGRLGLARSRARGGRRGSPRPGPWRRGGGGGGSGGAGPPAGLAGAGWAGR